VRTIRGLTRGSLTSGTIFCGEVLSGAHLSLSALETEDHVVFAGMTDEGAILDESQCRRLFDLPAAHTGAYAVPPDVSTSLRGFEERSQRALLEEMATRNGRWFDIEMDKLDHWADDRRASLRAELSELDDAIKDARKAARLAPNLPDKLERQRDLRKLEAKRDDAWREYDEAARDIERQKDAILDDISRRLQHQTEQTPLFTLRWQLC
jgi:hypothetical protein